MKPERERAREQELRRLEQTVVGAPAPSRETKKEDTARYTEVRYGVGNDGYFNAYEHDTKGWSEEREVKNVKERAHRHFARQLTGDIQQQGNVGIAEDGMIAKTRSKEIIDYELSRTGGLVITSGSSGPDPSFEKKYQKRKKILKKKKEI